MIDKGNSWPSNCDQTANAAIATFRPPLPLLGFAPTSARSAPIAWTTCWRMSAPTAAAASHHGPFARRRNGVPGYRSRSAPPRTNGARCRTAEKRSLLTVSGSGVFRLRSDKPPRRLWCQASLNKEGEKELTRRIRISQLKLANLFLRLCIERELRACDVLFELRHRSGADDRSTQEPAASNITER